MTQYYAGLSRTGSYYHAVSTPNVGTWYGRTSLCGLPIPQTNGASFRDTPVAKACKRCSYELIMLDRKEREQTIEDFEAEMDLPMPVSPGFVPPDPADVPKSPEKRRALARRLNHLERRWSARKIYDTYGIAPEEWMPSEAIPQGFNAWSRANRDPYELVGDCTKPIRSASGNYYKCPSCAQGLPEESNA